MRTLATILETCRSVASGRWSVLASHAQSQDQQVLRLCPSDRLHGDRVIEGGESSAVPDREREQVDVGQLTLDSIRGFAGENVEAAVVPAVVREMMVEYDQTVRHYEIVG